MTSTARSQELDYLKGVLILLMIAFHLVYFEHLYPYAKQVVYTFHMPAFLLVSGYLVNVAKTWRQFLITMMWIAVPYAIMESAYVVAASLLPVSDHVDYLTPALFLDKLLLNPLGPYWYLHTMIVCGLITKAAQSLPVGKLARLLAMAVVMAVVSLSPLTLSLPCAMYYLAGHALRTSGQPFTLFFPSTLLAVLPFAALACFPSCLSKATPGGAVMVYLSVCSLLAVYRQSGTRLRQVLSFLGRRSLLLYVFSPVFTLSAKALVPFLSFDPTGLLFLVLSLLLAVCGSLAIGYVLDRLHISPWIFGKNTM
ncbi:MAG: acyltransferase family protein [Prevotella sp.]|nr:acyltransferase family protein [Prevotella sp.]